MATPELAPLELPSTCPDLTHGVQGVAIPQARPAAGRRSAWIAAALGSLCVAASIAWLSPAGRAERTDVQALKVAPDLRPAARAEETPPSAAAASRTSAPTIVSTVAATEGRAFAADPTNVSTSAPTDMPERSHLTGATGPTRAKSRRAIGDRARVMRPRPVPAAASQPSLELGDNGAPIIE